jgi:hypothetical protein
LTATVLQSYDNQKHFKDSMVSTLKKFLDAIYYNFVFGYNLGYPKQTKIIILIYELCMIDFCQLTKKV